MSFEAITLQYLEDALSECFKYHNTLDNFLIRAGVSRDDLATARADANKKAKGSPREYARAPKRFVVQSLITNLTSMGNAGDYALSNLITNVLEGKYPDATDVAQEAKKNLAAQILNDKVRKEEEQGQREAWRRKMERESEKSKEKVFAKMQSAKECLT